jgi:hypothetical protein
VEDTLTLIDRPDARTFPATSRSKFAARLAPDPSATVLVYCSGPGCGQSRVEETRRN